MLPKLQMSTSIKVGVDPARLAGLPDTAMATRSEPETMNPLAPKPHILTVMLEDFFHGGAFADVIGRRKWYRFDQRFEQNTQRALDLLDRHKAKATFFVMGWVAERRPDVIQEVVARGHEVASSGYAKRSFRQMTPAEFREDLRRSRDLIEQASGTRVSGFRVADRLLSSKDLWALEVLAEEGYAYDSSLSPSLRSFSSEPWRRFPHELRFGDRKIWEFPLPTVEALGFLIPIAGGNYLRQFPEFLIKPAVARWQRTHDHPFVLYFRVWDLDAHQPVITGAPLLARIRHYRHPDKMPELLSHLLSQAPYISIREHLKLEAEPVASTAPAAGAVTVEPRRQAAAARTAATIVVPCFNEELILPYLSNTLRELQGELAERYDIHYTFVDDGSTDGTWSGLQNLSAVLPNTTLLRHDKNQGVAAAIMNGIRNAQTEIVCSIDCDCTYDPRELSAMIPLLKEGVDLVTASPYHPDGKVLRVSRWRLLLSKSASMLYRITLNQSLHTYTSCFRVYRRQSSIGVELAEKGFLGVAEMIGQMAMRGAHLVEHPAVLEVRVLGYSKMKVLRTIGGHLRLLSYFAGRRLLNALSGKPSSLQDRAGAPSIKT